MNNTHPADIFIIEMSIPLDPREVLQTLNGMGYRNISAGQLKEFIKDLKRFIIYENRYSNIEEVFHTIVSKSKATTECQELSHFDKLHVSSTQASRAKTAQKPTASDKRIQTTCSRPNTFNWEQVRSRQNQENQTPISRISRTAHLEETDTVLCSTTPKSTRQGVIPIPPHIELSAPSVTSKATSTTSINRRKLIRNTPTDLYQYYQKDWDRFKKYLPGENSRSSVRMDIRRKMEQPLPPKPKVYLRVGEDHKKVLTRL